MQLFRRCSRQRARRDRIRVPRVEGAFPAMKDLFGDPPRHDAGGMITLPIPPALAGSAIYGGARQEYRYTISRT